MNEVSHCLLLCNVSRMHIYLGYDLLLGKTNDLRFNPVIVFVHGCEFTRKQVSQLQNSMDENEQNNNILL